ncbi:D-amino-acid transaminase [Aliidongia dinghuensis]|uniref:D-alanine aminotransferase n=1 Tax=Aliidongia dinghuensis TaxID=1867774 RepID=A0A8J2YTZ1_9PROT|nr:D-amino-acid transaminase [Aliidongia dinghuensis]GGF14857.1 D-amino-acid transaminase [Aliidongia dinghuensis]
MSRFAYVNGRFVRYGSATVHIEDRGYQFADGVYEVIALAGGKFVDLDLHLQRLDRSLSELRIERPMSDRALTFVLDNLAKRNGIRNGSVYLQITRGVAPRDFVFPRDAVPQVVAVARRAKPIAQTAIEDGVKAITIPDIRWARCDIKSVALLPAALGKQAAREAGAYEAWQYDRDGFITEGTSSNAWIVTPDGDLVTRPATNAILNGITRLVVIELAKAAGLRFVERPFSIKEAHAAREAFVTSTTSFVMPITQIDETPIGNGKPGSFTRELREKYMAHMAEIAGAAAGTWKWA